MKKIILVAFLISVFSVGAFASDRVSGHWRDTNYDGIKDTYVNPYERTHPNETRTDNYNYPGNYNPNSGRYNPPSDSPRENYPSNPNPYMHKKSRY